MIADEYLVDTRLYLLSLFRFLSLSKTHVKSLLCEIFIEALYAENLSSLALKSLNALTWQS
jgi:hypothetical protein